MAENEIAVNDARNIERFHEVIRNIEQQIAVDMVGQSQVVREVLITMIAGGNALLEGVPGLGKTRLVRILSRVMGLPFTRIQFTPDLMPADVTGTNLVIRDEKGSRFEFQRGPIFANLVLADEINRATPKTQSALLEAMQEHTVTVAGQTRKLPQPFFVLATQNPLEQEGTYPLPEAQLDRFFFKILVDFPSMEELLGIVELTGVNDVMRSARVADGPMLLALREVASQVPIARAVKEFAIKLVMYSHPEEPGPEIVKRYVRYGASPRAAQALIKAARVQALMEGRFNVAYEDMKAVAPAIMRHRMFLNFDGIAEGLSAQDVLNSIIEQAEREARNG